MAKWEITSAPATEPITTAEAKSHLFIESSNTDWDDFIDDLIKAARQYVEAYLGRALITQTIKEYYDCFPDVTDHNNYGGLVLRWPPVVSITSVQYIDGDGDEQTVSSGNYKVDNISEPTVIAPAYGYNWPGTRDEVNAVYVIYIAGYGAASAVPQTIKQAMLLIIKDWFDCRDDAVRKYPTAASKLLDTCKMHAL